MQYIDLDLIKQWYGQDVYITLGNLLRYAASKNIIDMVIPFPEYVDVLLSLSDNIRIQASRDDKGRPTFSVGGITVTALIGEDADKYRILK